MKQMVEEILVRVCGTPDVLREDIDLIESGLLDSLAYINLLAELEEEGIELQPTAIETDSLRTVASIVRLVEEYEEQAG